MKNLLAKLSQLRKPKEQIPEFVDSSEFSHPSEVLLYRKISIVISIAFFLIFVANIFLDFSLNTQKAKIDSTVEKINTYADMEKNYRNTAETLVRYKSLMSSKSTMYDRFLLVYYSIPEGVKTESLKIDSEKFTINLSSANILLFSKLIDTYINSPLVKTLYLDSASLRSTDQEGKTEYNVTLRGIFK